MTFILSPKWPHFLSTTVRLWTKNYSIRPAFEQTPAEFIQHSNRQSSSGRSLIGEPNRFFQEPSRKLQVRWQEQDCHFFFVSSAIPSLFFCCWHTAPGGQCRQPFSQRDVQCRINLTLHKCRN